MSRSVAKEETGRIWDKENAVRETKNVILKLESGTQLTTKSLSLRQPQWKLHKRQRENKNKLKGHLQTEEQG